MGGLYAIGMFRALQNRRDIVESGGNEGKVGSSLMVRGKGRGSMDFFIDVKDTLTGERGEDGTAQRW